MTARTAAKRPGRPTLLVPVPPGDSGYGLRMRGGLLLEGLARLGPVHVVVVPVLGPEPPDLAPWAGPPGATVTVVDVDPLADERADLVERLAESEFRAPFGNVFPRPTLCRSATLRSAREIARLVGDASVIVVTRLYLAPFLDVVLADPDRPPCVLDVDDVESTTRSDLGQDSEAGRYEALVRHYLPRFDTVLACSRDDADDLTRRTGVPVDVVPNAVRIPTPGPSRPYRWDLLVVANFGYPPSADAARWLCREVSPRLPAASIAIVGRTPPSDLVALARTRGAFVSGAVTDVAPYYSASRVAVVPLQSGGGTSIKLIEAMAHQRPVVTTPAGARGVPIRVGEHAVVASDPADFAAGCARLLADPELARTLGRSGYDFVCARHDLSGVAGQVADLCTDAQGRPRPRPG